VYVGQSLQCKLEPLNEYDSNGVALFVAGSNSNCVSLFVAGSNSNCVVAGSNSNCVALFVAGSNSNCVAPFVAGSSGQSMLGHLVREDTSYLAPLLREGFQGFG
jgi:hypothetical protein